MIRVPMASPKVGKFKSSPLTGGERSRIVVAEQVRQDMMTADEERISDEKKEDDAVHVKKEDDSGYL